MPYCTKCGSLNQETAKYCMSCGSIIIVAMTPVTPVASPVTSATGGDSQRKKWYQQKTSQVGLGLLAILTIFIIVVASLAPPPSPNRTGPSSGEQFLTQSLDALLPSRSQIPSIWITGSSYNITLSENGFLEGKSSGYYKEWSSGTMDATLYVYKFWNGANATAFYDKSVNSIKSEGGYQEVSISDTFAYTKGSGYEEEAESYGVRYNLVFRVYLFNDYLLENPRDELVDLTNTVKNKIYAASTTSTPPPLPTPPQSLTPNFQLFPASQSVSVSQGSSTTVDITVISTNNFNSPVSLNLVNPPSGISASFNPASITPPANGSAFSVMTITASFSAAAQSHTVSIQGTASSIARSISLSVTISQSEAVRILSHTSYVDIIGYFHVVGEVESLSTLNLEFVQITATFYNRTNTVIGTDFTYTRIDVLTPGQKSPFEILSLQANLFPDHYSLRVADFETTAAEPYMDLQILSHSSSVDILGYTHVVGEVQNTGSQTVSFVNVIMTGYNTNGIVIATDFTYTNPSTLSPGQIAPFEILVLRQNLVLATYVLQVQA